MLTKAQMSFELMVYLAIAGTSMVATIPIFAKAAISITNANAGAELENFVAQVNANMAYQKSAFHAFVPGAICGAGLYADRLVYANQSYYLDAELEANGTRLCEESGGVVELNLVRLLNGTYLLN